MEPRIERFRRENRQIFEGVNFRESKKNMGESGGTPFKFTIDCARSPNNGGHRSTLIFAVSEDQLVGNLYSSPWNAGFIMVDNDNISEA